MTDLPRWSVEDVLTRYYLEPSLQDVFVEGIRDKNYLEKCKHYISRDIGKVYDIDNVDLPLEVVRKYFPTTGNKQRVATLYQETLGRHEADVRFIVDRDFDFWLGIDIQTDTLRYTMHTDMDMAIIDEEIVVEILRDAALCKVEDWNVLFRSIVDCAKLVASLRIALRRPGHNVKLVDLGRIATLTGSHLSFNFDDFAHRSLNGKLSAEQVSRVIEDAIRIQEEIQQTSFSDCTRSHDIVTLIVKVISLARGKRSFADETVIEGTLMLLAPRRASQVLAPLL